jgi:glycosyl transferase family 87
MRGATKAAASALAIAAACLITAPIFHYVPLHDFVEYWTAAHVFVTGHNPYSIEALMRPQQAMGWTEEQPLMIMSPPHFLPLLIPLGFVHSYRLARLFWWCLSVTTLVFATSSLWLFYGGDGGRRWIPLCVAAMFFPVWHCLAVGQIGPLLLLGVVGFLWLEKRGHLLLSGSALALSSFKPHLFYLLWLSLLLWSVQRREMRVLFGASVTILLGLLAALAIDPEALSQYLALVRSGYVWEYSSGAGGVLRSWLAPQSHSLQFLPMLPGLLAFATYWHRYRLDWKWRDRLPMVLALSVLTAAYGWPFDEVVLLVPVLMIAAGSIYDARKLRTFVSWLVAMFVVSLAVVLRYGDAGGMTICATGIVAYLVFDSILVRKRVTEAEHDTPLAA